MSIILVIATAVSLILTPIAKKLAVKCDAVSRPDMERKKHAMPTAQWGGMAVYLAILAGIVAWLSSGVNSGEDLSLAAVIVISGGLLCLLGAYDDATEIRASWKLIGQVVGVLPVVAAGYYFERISIFGFYLELGWLGAVVTVAWMILAINAMNLIDGMDGLASMLGIIMAAAIALIAGYQGQIVEMTIAAVLAASLIGFVVYNLPPARIYLGDCGSMFIGFILSLLAVQVSLGEFASVNFTTVAVLFFVPLLDTGLAVLRRSLKGKSFFTPDREHVHHRLLDRGLKPKGVLALLGGICIISGVYAWLTISTQREIPTWIALAVLMAILVSRRLIGHEEWSIATRFLLRSAIQITRRPDLAHKSSRVREIIPRFHWKIVGSQESMEPGETAKTVKSTQEEAAWEAHENKAA